MKYGIASHERISCSCDALSKPPAGSVVDSHSKARRFRQSSIWRLHWILLLALASCERAPDCPQDPPLAVDIAARAGSGQLISLHGGDRAVFVPVRGSGLLVLDSSLNRGIDENWLLTDINVDYARSIDEESFWVVGRNRTERTLHTATKSEDGGFSVQSVPESSLGRYAIVEARGSRLWWWTNETGFTRVGTRGVTAARRAVDDIQGQTIGLVPTSEATALIVVRASGDSHVYHVRAGIRELEFTRVSTIPGTVEPVWGPDWIALNTADGWEVHWTDSSGTLRHHMSENRPVSLWESGPTGRRVVEATTASGTVLLTSLEPETERRKNGGDKRIDLRSPFARIGDSGVLRLVELSNRESRSVGREQRIVRLWEVDASSGQWKRRAEEAWLVPAGLAGLVGVETADDSAAVWSWDDDNIALSRSRDELLQTSFSSVWQLVPIHGNLHASWVIADDHLAIAVVRAGRLEVHRIAQIPDLLTGVGLPTVTAYGRSIWIRGPSRVVRAEVSESIADWSIALHGERLTGGTVALISTSGDADWLRAGLEVTPPWIQEPALPPIGTPLVTTRDNAAGSFDYEADVFGLASMDGDGLSARGQENSQSVWRYISVRAGQMNRGRLIADFCIRPSVLFAHLGPMGGVVRVLLVAILIAALLGFLPRLIGRLVKEHFENLVGWMTGATSFVLPSVLPVIRWVPVSELVVSAFVAVASILLMIYVRPKTLWIFKDTSPLGLYVDWLVRDERWTRRAVVCRAEVLSRYGTSLRAPRATPYVPELQESVSKILVALHEACSRDLGESRMRAVAIRGPLGSGRSRLWAETLDQLRARLLSDTARHGSTGSTRGLIGLLKMNTDSSGTARRLILPLVVPEIDDEAVFEQLRDSFGSMLAIALLKHGRAVAFRDPTVASAYQHDPKFQGNAARSVVSKTRYLVILGLSEEDGLTTVHRTSDWPLDALDAPSQEADDAGNARLALSRRRGTPDYRLGFAAIEFTYDRRRDPLHESPRLVVRRLLESNLPSRIAEHEIDQWCWTRFAEYVDDRLPARENDDYERHLLDLGLLERSGGGVAFWSGPMFDHLIARRIAASPIDERCGMLLTVITSAARNEPIASRVLGAWAIQSEADETARRDLIGAISRMDSHPHLFDGRAVEQIEAEPLSVGEIVEEIQSWMRKPS